MVSSDIQVLCVGNVTPHCSVQCDLRRLPSRAPVPISRLRGTREMLAGAGDVAADDILGQVTGTEVVQASGGRSLLASLLPGVSGAGAVARMRRPAVPA